MWDFWADWFSFYIHRSAAFFSRTLHLQRVPIFQSPSFLPLGYLSTSMALLFPFFSFFICFPPQKALAFTATKPILSDIFLETPLTTGCICICACVITPCSVLLLHFFFNHYHYHWHCIACIASLASGFRELIRFQKFCFSFRCHWRWFICQFNWQRDSI